MCDNQVVNGETKAGGCELANFYPNMIPLITNLTNTQMPSTLSCAPRPPYGSRHTSMPRNMPLSSAPE